MSTVEKARKMFGLAMRFGLKGTDFASDFSYEQMSRDYNGIGPEWFPPELRMAIDAMNVHLQPVAFIHDVRWSHSDGTYFFFTGSNREFKENGYVVAKRLYGWLDPRRYLLMNKARIFGNLCQAFGRSAYDAAYRKQKEGSRK